MITTVCLNPSFDKTVDVDTISLGGMNRIQSVRLDMGGKGLNVAGVAHRLGLDVQCIGCMGRENAAVMDRLIAKEGLKVEFLPVNGSVRTNLKVISQDGTPVTEFNEEGDALTAEEWSAFEALLAQKASQSEYVVLTGSARPGCLDSVYRDLMNTMPGIPCILDSFGTKLLLGLEAKPYLAKVNLAGMEATMGTELRTLRQIRDAALMLNRRGAQHVVVSMGKVGAMYSNGTQTLFAPSLNVRASSTVGASDAMIAGILLGLRNESSMEKAMRYGVAASAATVVTTGTQLLNLDDFERLLPQVQLQAV